MPLLLLLQTLFHFISPGTTTLAFILFIFPLLIIPHMLSLSLSALGGEQGGGGSIDPWKCSFQLDGNSSPPPPPSCGFHAPSQSDLEGVNEWMNKWMDE